MQNSEHPIQRYLREHNSTQQEFADMVGLSLGYVNDIATRRKACGGNGALKIHAGTQGAITVLELLQANPPKKPRRGRPKRKGRKSRVRRKRSTPQGPRPESPSVATA